MRRSAVLLALLGGASAGIYPDGHFDVSTKLTLENYKDVIQSTIDSGKTLMAPAWNAIVQAFKDNEDVAFADINLAEESIREAADGSSFGFGAGGWPTVRYFNKETGVAGAPYKKKTDKPMCEELGPFPAPYSEHLKNYVEEAAGTSLCTALTGVGCSDKEKDYAGKWKGKGAADIAAQFERLQKMSTGSMKPDALAWAKQRMSLLKQLKPQKDEL